MSIYQRQLELLVYGYMKQHSNGLFIPFALLNTIIQWHSKEPKLIVNILENDFGFVLECYLDEPSNKLLNIDKYIVSYTFNDNDSKESKQEIIKCFDNDYSIGFIEIGKADFNITELDLMSDGLVEVTAVDENDNDLIKSEKLRVASGCPFYFKNRCKKDFDIIDIDHKGYVNLDEWILAMKRLNVGFNELLYIRIFCYMNFKANCYQNLKVKEHQLVMFLRQNHIKWKNKDYGEIVKVLRTICFP
eukprot:466125_1